MVIEREDKRWFWKVLSFNSDPFPSPSDREVPSRTRARDRNNLLPPLDFLSRGIRSGVLSVDNMKVQRYGWEGEDTTACFSCIGKFSSASDYSMLTSRLTHWPDQTLPSSRSLRILRGEKVVTFSTNIKLYVWHIL